jgi:hypothetical protein
MQRCLLAVTASVHLEDGPETQKDLDDRANREMVVDRLPWNGIGQRL